MRIGLASCRALPEPDHDEALTLAAFAAAGFEVSLFGWNDPVARPEEFDAVVIRSTWDYHLAPADFTRWIERLDAAPGVALWNPADHVLPNIHKRYLLALEQEGIPILPTALVEAGATTTLREVADGRGWTDVVVKPEVSGGSWRTARFQSASDPAAQEFFAELVAERPTLVQPYVSAVERGGERVLVWIDGELTHAIHKAPRFVGQEEVVSEALAVEDDERAFAARVLDAWAGDVDQLLYARIDVVRDGETLRLSELELIEPSLFFLQAPAALERFVQAVGARLDAR